jgi:uncharacterized protein (DUF486 family)
LLSGAGKPAGPGHFSAAQLKDIQEVISLSVFAIFSVLYLREQFRWNYLVGFVLILAAVFFVFKKWYLVALPLRFGQ